MIDSVVSANPSAEDVLELKERISDTKRQQEFAQLKTTLGEMTVNAQATPNEFEGGMQMPDTQRVLKTKREKPHVIELVLGRLGLMLGVRPVIGNMIAIGVALAALVVLQHEVILHGFAKYQHYIGIGLLAFAGLKIIKSATRSLLLPLVATAAGAVVSHSLGHHHLLFGYGVTFYQYVMIVGIIGLGISVLSID